jgi:hypothetical protein
MKKLLTGLRSTYKPKNMKDLVRITPENCVLFSDMHMLKPVKQHTVSVCGHNTKKWFQPIDIDGNLYLAETVTGSLYREATGLSSSPCLCIVK